MSVHTPHAMAELYVADETAWLERSAALIRAGRFGDLDPDTLAEYLTDMARRDKREVTSRLVVLLTHLLKWEHQPDRLKWEHQPDRRTGSWRATINEQRWEVQDLLQSRTLRNHAEEILADAYRKARVQAACETDMEMEAFPADNPRTLDEVVNVPEE